MNISIKLVILLLLTLHLSDTIQSLHSENQEITSNKDQDISTQILAAGIPPPVVSASLVYNRLQHKLDSPDEDEQEEAKGILESLLSQIRGTTEQYGKITMHGIQYMVNMGKMGTALRAHNEETGLRIWEILRQIFAKILSIFGIVLNKNFDERDKYNKDTLIFDIITSNQLIKRFDYMVREKRDLLERVRHSKNSQVTERVFKQVGEMIETEEQFLNDLKIHVKEQEERLKKFKD